MFEYGTYGMIGISIATLSFLAAIFFLGWAIRGIFHQKVAPTGQQMPGDDTGVSREVEELRAELDRRKALANFGSKIAHELLSAVRRGFQVQNPSLFDWTVDAVREFIGPKGWIVLEIRGSDTRDGVEGRFTGLILRELPESFKERVESSSSIYSATDLLEVAVRSREMSKLIVFIRAIDTDAVLEKLQDLLGVLAYECKKASSPLLC